MEKLCDKFFFVPRSCSCVGSVYSLSMETQECVPIATSMPAQLFSTPIYMLTLVL